MSLAAPGTAEAFRPDELVDFATRLFAAGGLDDEKARTVAAVLVEGDLLGHSTHGLHLAAPYLTALQDGPDDAAGRAGGPA
jgi:LDH2 family malate/lactate/ureidoglycolate dehydrogenase